MGLRLFDTASRAVVPFEPGGLVTMYVCGVTPYDATHLGHAATYCTFDVIRRRLVDLGHEVRIVRNITDVDDDILRKARELGVHYLDLAAAFHHVPAKELGLIDEPVESDVLICSDHPKATQCTIDIVSRIPGLRPLDAGELSNAAPIEAFAAVLLQLNIRYKTRAAVQFTGIAE